MGEQDKQIERLETKNLDLLKCWGPRVGRGTIVKGDKRMSYLQ